MKTSRIGTPCVVSLLALFVAVMLTHTMHAQQPEASWELKLISQDGFDAPYMELKKSSTVWEKNYSDGKFYPTPRFGQYYETGGSYFEKLFEHLGTSTTGDADTIAWAKYKFVVGHSYPDEPVDSVYIDFSAANYPAGLNDFVIEYDWDDPGWFHLVVPTDTLVETGTVIEVWDPKYNPESYTRGTTKFVPDSVAGFTVTAYPSGQHWPDIDFLSNGESFPVKYEINRKVDNGSFAALTSFSYGEGEAPDIGNVLQHIDTELAGAGSGNHLATYYILSVNTSPNPPEELYAQTTNRSIAWSHYGYGKQAATGQSPTRFELHPNYPNPFNPATTIRYELATATHATLTIYNVMGQPVRTLADGAQEGGPHSVIWDGRDDLGRPVSSGIYLYRLTTERFVKTRKMSLLK